TGTDRAALVRADGAERRERALLGLGDEELRPADRHGERAADGHVGRARERLPRSDEPAAPAVVVLVAVLPVVVRVVVRVVVGAAARAGRRLAPARGEQQERGARTGPR